MQTRVNELIEVLAKFKGGVVTPVFFKLSGRIYKISSINLRYDFSQGNVKFLSYSVSSGANSYKITLNAREMTWKLEEIFTN
jgi:hypothetical protein